MTKEEIDKAFEGRWRIYGVDDAIEDNAKVKEYARKFFEAGVMLGQSETSGLSPKVISAGNLNTLDARSKRFFNTLYTSNNVQKYGKQMLQDFYEYWSEPNPSNTKMRFELQKTWDVDRRLARWARNNYNKYDRQQSSDSARRDKLASILTD